MMMKIAIVLLLMLAVLIGCTAAPAEEAEEVVTGGVVNQSKPDAPKTIASTAITAFTCEFSTVLLVEDSPIAGDVYSFEAKLQDGAVTGICKSRELEAISFQANAEFLSLLQDLVIKHDLAQYNGIDYHTNGVANEYGAYLCIEYESGERIYASDNVDDFLPLEAMEDIYALFMEQTA